MPRGNHGTIYYNDVYPGQSSVGGSAAQITDPTATNPLLTELAGQQQGSYQPYALGSLESDHYLLIALALLIAAGSFERWKTWLR